MWISENPLDFQLCDLALNVNNLFGFSKKTARDLLMSQDNKLGSPIRLKFQVIRRSSSTITSPKAWRRKKLGRVCDAP